MAAEKKTIFLSWCCWAALFSGYGSAHAAMPAQENPEASAPGGTIGAEVLGRAGGSIHPFLVSSVTSTDNYQYVDTNEAGDLITTVSPGVWLSLSRLKERPETEATSTLIPGGHAMPPGIMAGVRRLHTFALYRGDFDFYSRHSEDNTIRQHLDGAVQYSFPGGLTVGLDDQFAKDFDPRETGSSPGIDRYTSNLVGLNLDYRIGGRLQVATRLAGFAVDYRAAENDYRDRDDRNISVSLPFALTAKTSIFAGYSRTDISYDRSAANDSEDHDVFAGLGWKMTGKSSGRFQAGYGRKRFDDPALDGREYLSLGVKLDHSFSARASVQFSGHRKIQESSVSTSDYILTDKAAASYRHLFTARWAGLLTAGCEREDFKGDDGGGRQDTIVSLRPALRFLWGERLAAELGCSLQERDSSRSEHSYRVNSIRVGLEFAL